MKFPSSKSFSTSKTSRLDFDSPSKSRTAKTQRPQSASVRNSVDFSSPSSKSSRQVQYAKSPSAGNNTSQTRTPTLYENMNFKSKGQELRSQLNPFKPHSDINLPSTMDGKLNTAPGRVLGGVTGESNATGVQQKLNGFGQSMRPGDSLTMQGKKDTALEAGFAASLADIPAPGIGMSGVSLGPTAGGGLAYAHGKTNTLSMNKNQQQLNLNGKQEISDEFKLKGSGGLGLGMDMGPSKLGPNASLNAEVGAKYGRTQTATLAPNQSPASEFTRYASQPKTWNVNGPQWNNVQKESKVTFPAQASAEMGFELGPSADKQVGQSGFGSLGVGVGVEDLRHPRSTAGTFVNGNTGVNTSVGAGKLGNLEGKIEHGSELTDTFKRSEQRVLHGSHYNHPFSRNNHVSQLDTMIGPGSSKLAIDEFRNEFGQNVPRRNMEFLPTTLDDGRMRVDGHMNMVAANGYNVKAPFLGTSNTNSVNIDQTRTLFETAEVVKPSTTH